MAKVESIQLHEAAEINPPPAREVLSNRTMRVSFVPMGAVSDVNGSVIAPEEREAGQCLKGYTPFIRGDVLVAKITPCFENGKIALANIPHPFGFGSTEFHVVRPDATRLEARFLFHILRHPDFRLKGSHKMTGSAGQRRVPEHFLSTFAIPLPPLAEQRRIAEILDKADALRAKRRAALAKLDELTQSIFLDMFGDPATNPKGWPTAALGEHTSKIGSGATPRGGEEAYKTSGITLIRSMNVRDGVFARDGLAFIDEEQASQLDGVIVEPDDVLLNITGASVARVCRAPADVMPARVNQHVAIIRPTAAFSSAFVEKCLLSPTMKQRLLKIAKAGATREAITKGQIEQLRLICPPRPLQDRFASALSVINDQIRHQEKFSGGLDALFASLQHRAFRGEL